MAEKKSDSKLMSMLERRGILRKAEDDTSDVSSSSTAGGLYDSDIKPLFDVPDDNVPVKTAPRQPVPGMTTPVFPSDTPAPPAPEEMPKPAAAAPVQQMPAPAPVPAATPSTFGGLNLFRNDDAPAAPPTAAMESVLSESDEPQPENYTDRYLDVDELYDALALRSKKTDTIYLIEDYLKTIPSSLPDSQRREIVSKILASSGFDFDLLMGDGVLRVKMLKEYAERFARHTDDYIAARQAELEHLEQQMARARKLIENRKELHKRQFYTIESEAQRLKEILTFISG